ncbi:sensor histidine kinase [Paenibacillus sp. 481]|uniref:sensor histidine kinase n=1 Tax=Paenibacillus sp. 481 TaxID=2835869 RepID=UPI001E4CCC01|nr:ATP-binding protein [Paenibacillus sp. 481]UHA75411.1 HAMP domain-containing histidine kinase [Paenibacillus sp. 481]
MLNSIFRKWLVASIAITVAILLILTITISWLVQQQFYRQGLNQLNDRSITVERAYKQFSQGKLTYVEFRQELKRVEQEHHIKISIFGKKVKYSKKDLYEIGVRPDIESWVNAVSEGHRIEEIAKFRKQDDSKTLIIGFPLMKNKQVAASAFVYLPIEDVKQLAAPIRKSVWLVSLAGAGPLILLLWFAARKFVRPIRKMDKAASSIANGDFTSRVEIKGNDEIARLGSSFNLMAERIERIEEQRGRLIMEVAHELRTPLTSIRGTLQALSDGILTTKEQQEFIALSLEETLRLGQLINNIHELSAFEEHQIKFEFKTVDLTELVDQTVLQFKHKAGMKLQVDMEKEKHISLEADPVRIRQLLINLIGNALDHNPEGTSVIVRLYGNQQKVKVIVQDNGRGIAPEHLPHLFERLYKAESSRSFRGSGLGLTISRFIVHAHGGTILVVSELGKGTEIHVELPLVRT